MNERDFAYWLQGFTELNPQMEAPSPEQWQSIKDHLKTVFVKITPEITVKPATMPEWPSTLPKRLEDYLRQQGQSPYTITC